MNFWSFFLEKTIPKMMRLFTAAPFFLELPTLTIVWFLQYESYFFSFGLFDVFHWKCLKIQPKTEAQKTTGKTCQGGPKIIPKCLKILRFCVRKCHLAPKQLCFAELFFLTFFASIFSTFLVDFRPIWPPKIEKTVVCFGQLFCYFSVFSSVWTFAAILVDFSCPRRPKM